MRHGHAAVGFFAKPAEPAAPLRAGRGRRVRPAAYVSRAGWASQRKGRPRRRTPSLRWFSKLAGWPGHGTAAEQVQVEVVNGLAAVRAGVYDNAVALGKLFDSCNLCRCRQQLTEHQCVTNLGVAERVDVLARHDEHMRWRLGMQVGEGVAELILVNRLGRDGSFNDFAEGATHSGTSVQERVLEWRHEAGSLPIKQHVPSGDSAWRRTTRRVHATDARIFAGLVSATSSAVNWVDAGRSKLS